MISTISLTDGRIISNHGDGMNVLMVALYRCKHCRARMFERDISRHLVSHPSLDGEPLSHFVRGKKDTPSKPGAHQGSMYNRPGRKAKKKT